MALGQEPADLFVRGGTLVNVYSGELIPTNVAISRETCECADFQIRNVTCKHMTAAVLAQAKSSPCSCCGQRVLNRFLDEVTEDDELLGWFVGDQLCADCVRGGYWT